MVQPKWKTFEEQVRGIAALIFGQPCQPARIAGVNFDGVIKRGELETIVVEISEQNDLDKVRQGSFDVSAPDAQCRRRPSPRLYRAE